MRISKFFDFTIKGDSLDPNAIKNEVDLPCKIYIKDEITKLTVGEKLIKEVVQKTNRWLYCDMSQDEMTISAFLTKNLEIIVKHLSKLNSYIKNYKTILELVIYAENKTNIKLSKKQIRLLDIIGVDLLIAFC